MTLTDDVIEIIKGHPMGMTTLEVLDALYPNLESWKVESRRCAIYTKLHMLEKHGLVEGTVIPKNDHGRSIKTWRWVEYPTSTYACDDI